MLKVVRSPPYQVGQEGSPRLSAPPLLRGAGGIRGKIYLQFNYNYLLSRLRLFRNSPRTHFT
ncbi:MAG: hypothetical protein EWV64_07180 [Microcystis flos-aquae Ma_QC_C_20070823_S18]|uniref:Uncharacterized protein n=1 Tax=Microcystis flos-aquae Mf_QC_C_20070823_S10D TaxID=2486236 RepID=A0A552L653_9CHRO|nr:MAG: hypothetical protein EWV64_07180 [Microcystis flos-aquae Ma_QC_C_20070823_S18]TRU00882.1 MAG: hypothetical protein EWV65_05810 [Microcystis flos-aquae Ma_QC_C_20070823_S18D]TRV15706.1 MAG: hypothetical protein EWV45_02525 [Microcystis flos-aquae Mf_QC_C_20070823_S10D]TRV27939.1 MAG: hypothetical protein EWV72_03780 [Microcystis flos-aquae Mf_QC_C_20070823_S10]TRV35769.1 MAG: hypothetical protein EWV44_13715 [Microcystis flos-aquae Mf_QC_C_20070823_S20T]TRV40158.1 MAG: hypothetical prot